MRLRVTGAGLLQSFDAFAISHGKRHCFALGQKIIARVTGANFDLVAFGAKAVDRFEEEDFVISHDRIWVDELSLN